MRFARVRNESRGTEVASAAGLADRFWLRLRGLLGRPPLQPGQGLLIRPCQAVHMLGMRYPIDVAFLDPSDRVVAVFPGLGPGQRSSWVKGARAALELPAGTLARTNTEVGDALVVVPVDASTNPDPAHPGSHPSSV